VVLDETALFRDEASPQPDIEIYRACVPALLTTKGMMVGISTPFGQRGLLFERYRDYFGRDDDEVLVVKGSSTKLNPTLDQGWIDAELARDPEANKAEYSAEFRTALSAYIDRTPSPPFHTARGRAGIISISIRRSDRRQISALRHAKSL
jgi:hypothetical protein